MIRTVFRDNRLLFGPLRENELAMISREPLFEGHGLCARATAGQVEVYATLPADTKRAEQIQQWYLKNHAILA